jgi:hypothetical protein
VKRLDEVRAAKHLVVKYGFGEHPAAEDESPVAATAEAPKGA